MEQPPQQNTSVAILRFMNFVILKIEAFDQGVGPRAWGAYLPRWALRRCIMQPSEARSGLILKADVVKSSQRGSLTTHGAVEGDWIQLKIVLVAKTSVCMFWNSHLEIL